MVEQVDASPHTNTHTHANVYMGTATHRDTYAYTPPPMPARRDPIASHHLPEMCSQNRCPTGYRVAWRFPVNAQYTPCLSHRGYGSARETTAPGTQQIDPESYAAGDRRSRAHDRDSSFAAGVPT